MYLEKKKKIDDREFGFRKQRSTIDATSKITTKILYGFRKKKKTAVIFFNIKKAYDKLNRNKTLEQQENMETQGIMLRFIRELIKVRKDLFHRANRETWEFHREECSV